LARHEVVGVTGRWLSRALLLFLLIAFVPQFAVAQQPPAPKTSTDETLLLEVQINGQSIGKIGEFTMRSGQLLVKPDELTDLTVRIPAATALQPGGLISLADIPGLTWKLDQVNQVLQITISEVHLLPKVILPNGSAEANGPRVIASGTGVTLNYDMVGTFANGSNSGAGSLDGRFFSPYGVITSDWLGFIGADSGASPNSAIRLDSAYSFENANTLNTVTLGDFISSGLSWTRPVRLEGAQILRDYRTRPDLVIFPLPTVNGSAAVPSTIQVLTNGNLVASAVCRCRCRMRVWYPKQYRMRYRL